VTCRTKSYWAASAVALLAGCGASPEHPASEQVAHVHWTESGDPHNLLGRPIVFRVRTIRVGPGGWSVDGSVTNKTKEPLGLVYAHEAPGSNAFGLFILETEGFAIATRERPPVPTNLRPGETWKGTFSGPDQIASGVRLRVQFGDFGTLHADRFRFITDHAYRVR
jgi:hypothetical protein